MYDRRERKRRHGAEGCGEGHNTVRFLVRKIHISVSWPIIQIPRGDRRGAPVKESRRAHSVHHEICIPLDSIGFFIC